MILRPGQNEIKIEKEKVFYQIECYQDSINYNELWEEYNILEPLVYQRISPKAFLSYDKIKREDLIKILPTDTKVLYVLLTLDEDISFFCDQLISDGRYLTSILVNAMADQYLFQMDSWIQKKIKDKCKKHKVGICSRLEAPRDIPIEIQKTIWKKTRSRKYGVSIKESLMFEPIKTMGYTLILSEKENEFLIQHNCKNCKNIESCEGFSP